MHEISLVRNIFRTLEAEITPSEIKNLQAIHLKIGLLSNVEPILLQNALAAVTETDWVEYKHIRLETELVPIRIFCTDCQQESMIEQYKFRCAHCGKPNNNIVSGTELLIASLEYA
ncbi:MAG: hydrogenase maturation nickel metallochaperone HypA [Bacteroidetes bacterium]|nr:hydrogenase maturation nickel metallochaperone HypA [Bacteroidota bacterium]